MKRITIPLLIILTALLLASCRVKEDTETVTQETVAASIIEYTRWEYQSIPARCGIDMSTRDLSCYLINSNDTTLLSNYLASQGMAGWELSGIINAEDSEGIQQTLVFKRPLPNP